ncbi:hypothetical protein AN2V17_45460 [Vallitalea sp. AN17-2]|uniref:Uncharacterized protein n=1 Tax=Vallitalea maricola TaxID=3074433 RepID=A0ACB5URJ4_9FIRM|nr:hypothetical protein AN2V17_45460 [Vallitalea sp. AN17-2]
MAYFVPPTLLNNCSIVIILEACLPINKKTLVYKNNSIIFQIVIEKMIFCVRIRLLGGYNCYNTTI